MSAIRAAADAGTAREQNDGRLIGVQRQHGKNNHAEHRLQRLVAFQSAQIEIEHPNGKRERRYIEPYRVEVNADLRSSDNQKRSAERGQTSIEGLAGNGVGTDCETRPQNSITVSLAAVVETPMIE